jgi:hypothetical protein
MPGKKSESAKDPPKQDELVAEKPKGNIHERMLQVMRRVTYLRKDEKAPYGDKFAFISHDKLMGVLRGPCIEFGVYVQFSVSDFPEPKTITDTDHKGNETTKIWTRLEVTARFINVNDPTDEIVMKYWGYALSRDDKGVGIATSYACKTALLKAFLLETGEEDAESREGALHDQEKKNGGNRKKAEVEADMRLKATEHIVDAMKDMLLWDESKKGEIHKWFAMMSLEALQKRESETAKQWTVYRETLAGLKKMDPDADDNTLRARLTDYLCEYAAEKYDRKPNRAPIDEWKAWSQELLHPNEGREARDP